MLTFGLLSSIVTFSSTDLDPKRRIFRDCFYPTFGMMVAWKYVSSFADECLDDMLKVPSRRHRILLLALSLGLQSGAMATGWSVGSDVRDFVKKHC